MTSGVAATLERARDLSRELLAAAGSGDSRSATDLDGQRLLLLQSVCQSARPLSPNERRLLQEISELNDKSIGLLEHHRRIKGRQLDTAAVGRRAVHAYATTRPLR